MTLGLSLLHKLFGTRIARGTRRHLAAMTREERDRQRSHVSALLRTLAGEQGPHVCLGETPWTQPVLIPLALLATAFGIITGGTGSGKSMTATVLLEALLSAIELDLSFGVVDAKGELFDRTLYLVARTLKTLSPAAAERLRERLVIVELDSLDPVTSYNIASPRSGGDLDYFATCRSESLQELFPSGDGLSLRGASLLKNIIKLLAEQRLPFTYFDEVISSEALRSALTTASKDDELRHYFQAHFPNESRATVAAVRARLHATLLSSASLKLALSGASAPDFRELQDTNAIVLIKCAGQNIPRATARTLQGLFLADIREAIFARQNQRPFIWIFDEAQNFFRTKFLRENVADMLTQARSFGSHCTFLTQNISTAVQDSEILETLHTNIRWSLTLRSTPKDAAFLQPALPISGRRQKPRSNPYVPPEFYSPSEERALLMQDVAHLPDRSGWLWLKSLTGEAFQIRTPTVNIPSGTSLKKAIQPLRSDPSIGRRYPRQAYLDEIGSRKGATFGQQPMQADRDIVAELTELYDSGEETGQ